MQDAHRCPREAAGERQDESQTSVRTNARSETAAKANARSETAAETKSAWRQAAALGIGQEASGRMQEAGHTAKRGAPGERQDECKKPYSFHEERQDDSTESLASARLSR